MSLKQDLESVVKSQSGGDPGAESKGIKQREGVGSGDLEREKGVRERRAGGGGGCCCYCLVLGFPYFRSSSHHWGATLRKLEREPTGPRGDQEQGNGELPTLLISDCP